MARRTIAIGVAILSVLLLLGFVFLRQSPRQLSVTYAGLLKKEGGIHAGFWITNGSARSYWALTEFSRMSNTGWVSSIVSNTWIHETIPTDEQMALTCKPGLIELIGIPIVDTQSPMRIVIQCYESGGIVDDLKQMYQRRVRKRSVIFVSGHTYSVINEVDPNSNSGFVQGSVIVNGPYNQAAGATVTSRRRFVQP